MKKILCLFIYLSIHLGTANATIIFSDDFESDLSQWSTNNSGVLVPDPLEADTALSFGALVFGGDIFSTPINNPYGGQYILSFDYLGTCAPTSNRGCGGFIGYDPGDIWIAGSSDSTSDAQNQIFDTGQWEHYSFSFTGPSSLQLKIEDFAGSQGVAGDIFFDNIQVEAVPIPAAVWLFGSGLLGLLGMRKKSFKAT